MISRRITRLFKKRLFTFVKNKKKPLLLFNSSKSKNLEDQRQKMQVVKDRLSNKGLIEDDFHQKLQSNLEKELSQKIEYRAVEDNLIYNLDETKGTPLDIDNLNIVNIENEDTFYKISELEHQLSQIVENPGIYRMDEIAKLQKDGGKFLRNIPGIDEIDHTRIPPYVPPSKDKELLKFAVEHGVKYIMSTSTISSALVQMYFLFSNFKDANYNMLSSSYDKKTMKYMNSQKKPTTAMIRKVDKKNGIYSMDSDKGLLKFENDILMRLGHVLERQLTMTKEEFSGKLLKGKIDPTIEIEDDHYRFMKMNNQICLRSQIDCRMKQADGSDIVFEIKTRSLSPIRYDLENYQEYLDYRIVSAKGFHSSFEREYYDLIRGGFMKYSFQLKIGRMDGALIAYHNTLEHFGFEYVKSEEIERRLFGSTNYSNQVFMCCSKLLTNLLDLVIDDLKNEDYKTMRIGFYSEGKSKKMIVFAEMFYDIDEYTDEMIAKKSDIITDVYDYYEHFWKWGRRKVLKYEYEVFVHINGILQIKSTYNFCEKDLYEVSYNFKKRGEAEHSDYMTFLNEAEHDHILGGESVYIGSWGTRN